MRAAVVWLLSPGCGPCAMKKSLYKVPSFEIQGMDGVEVGLEYT